MIIIHHLREFPYQCKPQLFVDLTTLVKSYVFVIIICSLSIDPICSILTRV